MMTQTKSTFSIVAFACPACVIGLAFATRLMEEERLAFQVVGVGGICFGSLALVGLIGAFVRKERMRWFTTLPVFILLAMFGLGAAV
jgi:hypothetical protein